MNDKVLEIVLVDDHAVVRVGFKLLLESNPRIKVVAELSSGEAVNQFCNTNRPDVIVMDISMPGMGGLEAIRRIKAKNPELKILVFTMHDGIAFVEQALEAGADGYVTKNNAANVLMDAVLSVADGKTWVDPLLAPMVSGRQQEGRQGVLGNLSRREFQIFCKYAEGRTTQEIANDLSLSIKTVSNYQTQIKEKLGAHSTTDLVKLALSHGVISV
ncbi:MAG: response regulator transcription factor [Pseudomonadota bacterium]